MQVDVQAASYPPTARPFMTISRLSSVASRLEGAALACSQEDIPDYVRDRAHLICAAFANSHKECREELQRQRTRIRERLREQLWSAACLRDYQLACVQRAYESEVEQIEREFETEKAQLKERVLADLLEHRRRLTEGRLEAREENAQLPGVSTGLCDAEIYEDLVSILREDAFSAGSRKTRQTAHPRSSDGEETPQSVEHEIFVKGEVLHCQGSAFVRGNSVTVGTPDSSELSGVISAVGAKDLWIRIDDGAKLKITYQQLKAGRYTLSHEEDESSADSS